MYESSSGSEEEVDSVSIPGAKPSKSSSTEKTKKKSKWDVTDSSVKSSSKKSSSSKSDSSHRDSRSRSSRHSSERSRRRRSSSRERSSSSRSSSKGGKSDSKSGSSSSRSRRHGSKSPPSKTSRSSFSESPSVTAFTGSAAIVGAGGVVPVVPSGATPTLSERWADLLPTPVVIPKGGSRWDVEREDVGEKKSAKDPGARCVDL